MMTKKHYVAIAAAANDARRHIRDKEDAFTGSYMEDGVSLFAEFIADACAQDNPNFDRARFLKACGVLAPTPTTLETDMINKMALYTIAGRNAGYAAKRGHLATVRLMREWVQLAIALETPDDRPKCRAEFDAAYRNAKRA